MYLAHIRKSGEQQTLREHCRSVSTLAGNLLAPCGLRDLGMLAGILHDQGKATHAFQTYLRQSALSDEKSDAKTHPHCYAGAIYAYDRWYNGSPLRKLTCQMIALAICGHHAYLPDCISPESNRFPFVEALEQNRAEICYDEAVRNYLDEVAGETELDELFDKACREVEALWGKLPEKMQAFALALTARLLLGAVADADCWDSACFERGENPFSPEPFPCWPDILEPLYAYMKDTYPPPTRAIDKLRQGVNLACGMAGRTRGGGIWRLTVPTGGGKTLASLRFALEMASRTGKTPIERVFYISPYNTILEQNADAIRKALGDACDILEHYADITFEEKDTEAEQRHYRLTERWTSPIILTSMVQFLDTLFRGVNRCARRMPRLMNSVVIFDEVQALPRKCTVLFECAIRFLCDCMGCTVLLCTATQPTLSADDPDSVSEQSAPMLGEELLPNVPELFEKLRRVRFVNETTIPRDNARAAADLAALVNNGDSALMVVNTRRVAAEVFQQVKPLLLEPVVCYHLSTNMCPAQRRHILDELRAALKARKADSSAPKVVCVTTALIEAGVDISFPTVIRSNAGLSSILQAAGRCNRSMEIAFGTVYIWRLSEERLLGLREIRQGQASAAALLDAMGGAAEHLDDPENIRLYYAKERHTDHELLFYREKDEPYSLCQLLSKNAPLVLDAKKWADGPKALERLPLRNSFRTAGRRFHAIDDNTIGVLVPYEKGAEIITKLQAGKCDMKEELNLLRQAQQYTVGLYESDARKLREYGALYPVGETGVLALMEGYLDKDVGVVCKWKEMELLDK